MLKLLKDIDGHRELLSILVSRNLKIRYKRSVLGFFWTLLNPLFFIIIYVTFLKILKFYDANDPMQMPSLVTGIIIWQFVGMCTGDALYAVLGNQSLVTKSAFPRSILPISTVAANIVNLALSLAILLLYLAVIGVMGMAPISFMHLGILPIVVATQIALCLGLCLILSCLNIFFRDTEHLLGVVMLAWFFMTPIIYPFRIIPLAYQKLAFLNPMCGIVVGYRAAFLGTGVMAPNLVMMSFVISWLTLIVGIVFFQKVEGNLAEHF